MQAGRLQVLFFFFSLQGGVGGHKTLVFGLKYLKDLSQTLLAHLLP